MSRDLRYDVLRSRSGLFERLRAIGASPRLVIGGTVSVLLLVVPSVVVAVLLAAGTLFDDGGAVALLAMLIVFGLIAVGSLLHEGGKAGPLERFARANGLVHVRASAAPDYAASRFADRSWIVDQSVRTHETRFAEVGDLFEIRAPRAHYDATLGRVRTETPNEPRLFLRGRLAGRVPAREDVVADDDLRRRVEHLAGEHVIELADDELTLFGTKRLDAGEPGRVEEAFALLDELVERADARLPAEVRGSAEADPDDPTPPRRTWGPLKVVALTLVLLIVVPLGFAFVMSIIDNFTRSRTVAVLAVNLFIAGSGALIALFLRRANAAQDDGARPRRRWRTWLLGAVGAAAFVALGVVAINLDQVDVNDDDAKLSVEECGADDPWCQEDVSTRLWAEDHGLSRVGEFDWQGCLLEVAAQRSACPVRVACTGGYADLVASLVGQPLEVVGARGVDDGPRTALHRSSEAVDRLVAEECRPA